MKNYMIIKKVTKERLREDIDFLFSELNVEDKIRDKTNVFIKPNIFCPEPANTGATVDLDLLTEVIDYFVCRGKSVKIGEAGAHQYDHEKLFCAFGLYELCSKHGAEFINLNSCDFRIVKCTIKGFGYDFPIPVPILDADFFVNLNKYKTHSATGISLAMKNMYGTLPGNVKWKGHALGLNETLAELNKAVPSDLVITDAMIAMEGFGPTMGIPIQKDVLIVSTNSAPIHDYSICHLQGFKGITHVELGVGNHPPEVSFYCYDLNKKPISRNEIDLGIKLLPIAFNRLWYKANEKLYKAGPKLEKINLSPRKIINTLVNRTTINFFRKIQSRKNYRIGGKT